MSNNTQAQGRDYLTEVGYTFTPRTNDLAGGYEDQTRALARFERELANQIKVGNPIYDLAAKEAALHPMSLTVAQASRNLAIGATPSFTPVTVYGGLSPKTFAVTPALSGHGLAMNTSTGAVTGTVTTAGTTVYTVTVTDAATGNNQKTATAQFTLVVA